MLYIVRSLLVFVVLTSSFSLYATDKIRIYAAASMTNVVNDIIHLYSEKTGQSITPVFAGSSSLARQIENGAPADIYISANAKWVDYLISKQIVPGNQSRIVAKNQLVLVKPSIMDDFSFDLENKDNWLTMLENSKLAVGQVDSVPVGIYAKQALTNIGVWDSVKNDVAPTNSVRIALALVERAEATAGIVYQTDALISQKVDIVAVFPEKSHVPIVYPMVILNESPQVADLASFILSNEAKDVFTHYGFN